MSPSPGAASAARIAARIRISSHIKLSTVLSGTVCGTEFRSMHRPQAGLQVSCAPHGSCLHVRALWQRRMRHGASNCIRNVLFQTPYRVDATYPHNIAVGGLRFTTQALFYRALVDMAPSAGGGRVCIHHICEAHTYLRNEVVSHKSILSQVSMSLCTQTHTSGKYELLRYEV